LDVIEEHAARQEPWLPHVRTRSDATQLKLRGAIASEVLAVAAAMLDDAETVAPFFAVSAERLALIHEPGVVDAGDLVLAHRSDVDPRERFEERTEDRFVERRRAPERAELENRFEHDTAV